MHDKLKNTKDTLVNFAAWVRARGDSDWDDGIPTPEIAEKIIDAFLATQIAGPHFGHVCTHCGSDKLKEGDFSSELFLDRDTGTKTAPSKSSGPAWVCVCGAYSHREVT